MMYSEYATGIENPNVSNQEYRKAEAVYLMLPPSLGHEAVYAIRKALGEKDAVALFDFIIQQDSEKLEAEGRIEALKRQLEESEQDRMASDESVRRVLRMVNAVSSTLDTPIQEKYADILAGQVRDEALSDWEVLSATFLD